MLVLVIGGIYAGNDDGGRVVGSHQNAGLDPLEAVRFLRHSERLDARLVLPDMQGATALAAAEQHADIGVGHLSDAEPIPVLPYVTAPTDTYTRFFEGYFAAGGLDEARVDAMIFCESSWRIDPPGIHLGLAQFEVGTWATVSGITGYTDPYSPRHQGWNVAVWASMVSPGTTAGWPNCFHAIDW